MTREPDAVPAASAITEEFVEALLCLDHIRADELMARAGKGPLAAQQTERVIVESLARIGQGWEKGEVALAQVYMAGRICEDIVDRAFAASAAPRKRSPRMAIATLDDYHFLGKRIVRSLLLSAGYEVDDFGRMTAADLADRAAEAQIELLLVSTLMLPSALQVRNLRKRLDARREGVFVAAGGAPFRFDGTLGAEVGADAVGTTASDVFEIIRFWESKA